MRRVFLPGGGAFLGLAAGAILWYAPELYLFTDSWHPAALTRIVGLAVIAEGILAALGAALCLGRAVAPLTPPPTPGGTAAAGPAPAAAGGGPVLPLAGMLFLLAAAGPFGQARLDSEALEVMDSFPGQWGANLVEDLRRHERAGRAFGVLWLAAGGGLLATPLFVKRRVWRLGWRMNGVGCGVAAGGLLLSGMGALLCYANGLAMEGASKQLSLAGYVGLLAGAIAAVGGGIIAVAGRAEA
jgi:hypothetical protein